MKCIIIEDCPSSCAVLREMLYEGFALKPDTARDGKQGAKMLLEAIEQGKPYELAFIDIMMPHQDGIEVLKALRSFENLHGAKTHCKVVIQTALEDEKTIRRAFYEGADKFMIKPYNIKELLEKVNSLLTGGRLK